MSHLRARPRVRVVRDRASDRWQVVCDHPACRESPSWGGYARKADARNDARLHRYWHQGRRLRRGRWVRW